MKTWAECKNILCIRPDNMGDVLMSAPAITALKETFGCRITLLTSPMGKDVAPFIPAIDETIVHPVQWVKGTSATTLEDFAKVITSIRERNFDGAVIFTVFSQSPLPSALIATLAGIPNRLAFCRENPYLLLSHWIPDEEPYNFVRHQVRRDLALVGTIGAKTNDDRITVRPPSNESEVRDKIAALGVDLSRPWLIMHPGASERKREYDHTHWVEAGKRIIRDIGYQVIITGSEKDVELADSIRDGIGAMAFSAAGIFILGELMTFIRISSLLISVNTGTIHLAAAMQTKVIVLYALTNPQHAPWKSTGKVLPFSIAKDSQSRNEILRFVQTKYYGEQEWNVAPDDIVSAAHALLIQGQNPPVDELILPQADPRFRVCETP